MVKSGLLALHSVSKGALMSLEIDQRQATSPDKRGVVICCRDSKRNDGKIPLGTASTIDNTIFFSVAWHQSNTFVLSIHSLDISSSTKMCRETLKGICGRNNSHVSSGANIVTVPPFMYMIPFELMSVFSWFDGRHSHVSLETSMIGCCGAYKSRTITGPKATILIQIVQ